ncbi:MAG: hypothetical protein M1834_006660 [Cirrosporium novae-zelandiae]|nr:MAG: hypothetical protein M1834_006660 [Cirrosporium novae-zelandiae]
MSTLAQQPVPQTSSTTTSSQTASQAHSPSPSTSGTTSQAAAVPAPTARSYANATKRSSVALSTPNSTVGGSVPQPQHGKSPSISPVNGRNPISPAVPAVNAPTIVNGNSVANHSSAAQEHHNTHSRKPSVTISAAGSSGYIPNGGPVDGSKPNNIQFGSIKPGGSPAPLHSTLQPTPNPSGLAANPQINPRVTSPQTSPSPIPQPVASGGRHPPPSSNFQGQGNMPSFGSMGGESGEANRRASGLVPGPQHMRRESSQSAHSDIPNPNMGPAASRGGYPQNAGRGRNFPPPYQQHVPYSPSLGYRNMQQQGRPNSQYGVQGGRPLAPFPNSPHQSARSPVPTNVTPVTTPQMAQAQLPMHQPHYGGYQQHASYPSSLRTQNRGNYNKNRRPSKNFNRPNGGRFDRPSDKHFNRDYDTQSSERGHPRRYQRSPSFEQPSFHESFPVIPLQSPPPFPPSLPVSIQNTNFSPESGNFEQVILTLHSASQNPYAMATPYPQFVDPAYYGGFPPQASLHQMPYGMPPSSPRPPYAQQPAHYVPGQYGAPPQAQPMSRTSSQVSTTDRPASSMGQIQAPPMTATPSQGHAQPASSRSSNSPAPKPNTNFKIPRKSAAISIKDPTTGVPISLDKSPASPALQARGTPSPVKSVPTPPPRSVSSADQQRSRSESQSIKTDAEKKLDFKDEVAKKIEADRAEEQRRKEEAQRAEKAAKDKAEAEAREREAAAIREKDEKEAKEKRLQAEAEAKKAEEAAAAEKKRQEEEEEAKRKAKEAEKKNEPEEIDYDAIEAEYQRMEEEERAAEEAYQKKKQAEKEVNAAKAKEAAANEEAELKRAEREAEEAEEKRLKELDSKKEKDDENAKLFASLKSHGGLSTPSDALASKSPAGSGTATPTSDISMPPPAKHVGKREKPAALKLETTKTIEPAQPSAALQSLRSAKRILRLDEIAYPPSVSSPNPALNSHAPTGRFKYDKEFLMQFQRVFTEKPSTDWDMKVADTVAADVPKSARTPSIAGLGPRGSSRHSLANTFNMGQFGQTGSRTLPPGTTSEQRFNATMGPGGGRPPLNNPLGSFGRGSFPMALGSMGRTPSSVSLHNQVPSSPRVGSHRGRQDSKRTHGKQDKKKEHEENKSMPLTAGMNLTPLQVSQTGWKPRSIGASANQPGPAIGEMMPPDIVQRKVKAALNKMTPEKFDRIADQILTIVAQSKNESDGRTLRQVISLTFDKATDEAHWASMYAMFCKRMLETMSPEIKDATITDRQGQPVTGGNLFRKYLLNRCQEEFEKGWTVNLPKNPEGAESHEAVMLSDEYYIAAAAKRRGLGLVKFIGELFKLQMLTERIMHECVKKLLEFEGMPDEAEVESLTSLLRTVGKNLDESERGHPMMDAYFQRIGGLMQLDGLNSRLRFMLLDVIDLRSKHWADKSANKGPKTIQEIREEAQLQAQKQELERMRQQSRGGGRSNMGRGDSRHFSSGMGPPQDYKQNTVGIDDLRRLGSRTNSRQVSHHGTGPSFGPSSLFNQRSNSGRRTLGPQLMRGGDDSSHSSRTGTPVSQKERKEKEEKEAAHANSFSALASLDPHGDHHDAGSPPSTSASPILPKVRPTHERTRSKSPTKKDA